MNVHTAVSRNPHTGELEYTYRFYHDKEHCLLLVANNTKRVNKITVASNGGSELETSDFKLVHDGISYVELKGQRKASLKITLMCVEN